MGKDFPGDFPGGCVPSQVRPNLSGGKDDCWHKGESCLARSPAALTNASHGARRHSMCRLPLPAPPWNRLLSDPVPAVNVLTSTFFPGGAKSRSLSNGCGRRGGRAG